MDVVTSHLRLLADLPVLRAAPSAGEGDLAGHGGTLLLPRLVEESNRQHSSALKRQISWGTGMG